MDVLPSHFNVLRIFGLWFEQPEIHWAGKFAFCWLNQLVVLYYTLLQAYNLYVQEDLNVKQITDTLFLLIIYIADLGKFLLFMARRDDVVELIERFKAPLSRAHDDEEARIIARHQRTARLILFVRLAIATTSCSLYFIGPIMATGKLTMPVTVSFFDLHTPIRYYFGYLMQVLAVTITAALEVTLDSVACAFIILACAQLELCPHRLLHGKSLDNSNVIGKFVNHHLFIQETVKKFESTFIGIIVPVYCFGLFTLCTTLFKFTQTSTMLVERMFGTFYLMYVLFPIYVFCWYGNTVQLMSEKLADAIYESEWTSLDALQRRSHWYLIFISQKKYEISYHGQCVLTLQTFIWMMKTSYGAFNLLQQVSL